MELREGGGMDCAGGNRVFDRRGGSANVEDCNQACLDDSNCIGHTINIGAWCFGCKVDASGYRDDGLNYMKTEPCGKFAILFFFCHN
jgi:hypothetical protein